MYYAWQCLGRSETELEMATQISETFYELHSGTIHYYRELAEIFDLLGEFELAQQWYDAISEETDSPGAICHFSEANFLIADPDCVTAANDLWEKGIPLIFWVVSFNLFFF